MPFERQTPAEAYERFGPGIASAPRHVMTIADGALRDTYDRRYYGQCVEHGRRAELFWNERMSGWGPCPIESRPADAFRYSVHAYFVPAA